MKIKTQWGFKIMKTYYEQVYSNKFKDTKEIDKLTVMYKMPKLAQKERELK